MTATPFKVKNGLIIGDSTTQLNNVLDEDNMASDSATALATQQSIKAYVDTSIGAISSTAISEGNSNVTVADSGAGSITATVDGASIVTIDSAGLSVDTVIVNAMNSTDSSEITVNDGLNIDGRVTVKDDNKLVIGNPGMFSYDEATGMVEMNQMTGIYAGDFMIKKNGLGYLRLTTDAQPITLNAQPSSYNGTMHYMAIFNPEGTVDLYYNNVKKFETTSAGVTVTGTLTETSSIEYKENVQPLEFNEAIYNVNAVKYDRKDGSQKDEVGVIAEDLYEILPDLVQTKDGKPESVKYTKLTMYLLEALKKQNEEIQELKKRIN